MIVIVEYGLGNIHAFSNIYRGLGMPFRVARTPKDLDGATKIILPGVGSFDWAMTRLNESGLRQTLDGLVKVQKVDVLGVCVGMQMMGNRSDEGRCPGLGWIDAEVVRLTGSEKHPEVRLPHMGWNDVAPTSMDGIFCGMSAPRFYFLHSYMMPARADYTSAIAEYGDVFAAAVRTGNIYGTQFHPEKSHSWGTLLLKNFAEL